MNRLVADQVGMSFDGSRGSVRALHDVSLTITSGELVIVRGPSGSGKSTLLAILGGLLRPTAGSVGLDGRTFSDLSESERAAVRLTSIGFIFQAFQLFETLNAFENVLLPMQLAAVRRGVARRRSMDLLTEMGMESRAALRPKQMSGGEQQRTAIARALALDPPVLLADEPTAALDAARAVEVMERLRDVTVRAGKLAVVISHDERLLRFATRSVTLVDGRIESDVVM